MQELICLSLHLIMFQKSANVFMFTDSICQFVNCLRGNSTLGSVIGKSQLMWCKNLHKQLLVITLPSFVMQSVALADMNS
jgi:hypothetical protein